MKAFTLLRIARDVTNKLEEMKLVDPSDDFVNPTPEQDAALALFVEQQLIKYGVPVPDKVVKVTQLVPLLLSMF